MRCSSSRLSPFCFSSIPSAFGQSGEIKKIYPFAPGSTNITAGEGGFVIESGSFPDDLLGTSKMGSANLRIAGAKISGKKQPLNYALAITDQRFEPASFVVPKRASLATFSIVNKDTKPHRFAGRFLQRGSVTMLDGKDVTLPPPVSNFPTVMVKEGSMINIADDKAYAHFYLELRPSGGASFTIDVSQYVKTSDVMTTRGLEIFCGLPRHKEKLVIDLSAIMDGEEP